MTVVVLYRQLWSFSLTTWVRDRDKDDSGGSLQTIVVFFTHPPPGIGIGTNMTVVVLYRQ